MTIIYYGNELYHHGIKGQKWGVRRYQNPDGSYTPMGRSRYNKTDKPSKSDYKKAVKEYSKSYDKWNKMAQQAEDETRVAKNMYKNLAKSPFGRVKEVIKAQIGKGSKLANDYIKQMDKASEMQDSADDFWRNDTMIKRMKTGRNSVERVLNNIKYDR